MQSQEAISVLQLFLSLSELVTIDTIGGGGHTWHVLCLPTASEELKGAVERAVEGEQLDSLLSTLSTLHQDYLTPSSPTFIPLVPDPRPLVEAALSPSLPPTQQWMGLRETRLVQTLYLQVYQILEETYYPQYCQSEQVGPIPIHSFRVHSHTPILPYIPSESILIHPYCHTPSESIPMHPYCHTPLQMVLPIPPVLLQVPCATDQWSQTCQARTGSDSSYGTCC